MSYKIKKRDLMHPDNICGRVILNGVNDDTGSIKDEAIEKLAKVDEWEIDMSVNGVEVDPTKFFNFLYRMYDNEVSRKAKKLLEDKITNTISDSINNLHEIGDKINSMNENTHWE